MVKELYIAGEWRLGRGHVIQSTFPADNSVNAEISTASPEDIEEAIAKADQAWRAPEWRNRMPHERAKILYKVADIIEARVNELSQLQTRDNGKPLAETRGLVLSAAATARYVAAACETLNDELTTQRAPDFMTFSVHEPVGVVAAITPWNSPIASEVQKLAPALAGGNAVILKPAEATSLIALELAKIFEEAGLPKGLLSVLVGKGSVVGDAIVKHPLVRKISFTGGTTTGRHLAHIAADKLITTSLELGGKSPNIFFESVGDADDEFFDKAVEGAVMFALNQGEVCTCPSRILVHENIYEKFKDEDDKFKVKSEELGRPLEAKVRAFQAEAQSFQQNVQAKGPQWAQQKGAELNRREQELGMEQNALIQQLQKEGNDLKDTLVSEVKKFIKDYGKKKGYDYVFGTGDAATVLYAKDGYDITKEVLKELNDTYKATKKDDKVVTKEEEKK